MKEETARELYEALKDACTLLSRATKTKGSPDEIVKAGVKMTPGMPKQLIKAAEKGGAMEFFRNLPDLGEQHKEELRTVVGDIPFMFRRAFTQIRKDLPYKRGKPTSEKLNTAQKKKDACEAVVRLLPFTENLEAACAQVGREYEASSRTIRRLWGKYQENLRKSAKAAS